MHFLKYYKYARFRHSEPFLLDFSTRRANIKASPPIRFRIEWARSQGIVTAPWHRAHFNVYANLASDWRPNYFGTQSIE